MDNLIYLIALIAWAAFAIYRKSQKKAEAERREQQRPHPREIISPFPSMKDIFEEESYGEVLPAPMATVGKTDGMAPQIQETEFAKEYIKRGISSVEEMDSPPLIVNIEDADIQEDELSEENVLMSGWRARIDLRQAVIYSEILNRPYV